MAYKNSWSIIRLCDNALSWCNNFISKTHYLRTGLKRGQYYDTQERLLHASMTALVDFVEVEQAWLYGISAKSDLMPWWAKFTLLRLFFTWRDADMGIEYLEVTSKLRYSADGLPDDSAELSDQALAAQVQLELYLWWKQYKKRIEIYDLGEPAVLQLLKKYPNVKRAFPLEHPTITLERAYYEEETDNLYRLIDIRNHLWT